MIKFFKYIFFGALFACAPETVDSEQRKSVDINGPNDDSAQSRGFVMGDQEKSALQNYLDSNQFIAVGAKDSDTNIYIVYPYIYGANSAIDSLFLVDDLIQHTVDIKFQFLPISRPFEMGKLDALSNSAAFLSYLFVEHEKFLQIHTVLVDRTKKVQEEVGDPKMLIRNQYFFELMNQDEKDFADLETKLDTFLYLQSEIVAEAGNSEEFNAIKYIDDFEAKYSKKYGDKLADVFKATRRVYAENKALRASKLFSDAGILTIVASDFGYVEMVPVGDTGAKQRLELGIKAARSSHSNLHACPVEGYCEY